MRRAAAKPTPTGPEGFDFSSDGKELWRAHTRDSRISVTDVIAGCGPDEMAWLEAKH
jgi:hypothetical protein